ncbi:type I secretion system permease/ATPase [Devosia sp.]|uniref:type I secretion system permease/ATPase n=1 Tax=Devosia sp. TaxID=1871048 RepID=UPI0035B27214
MLKRPDPAPAVDRSTPQLAGTTTIAALAFGVLSAASNLLLLAGPLFMLQVYDRVLPSRSIPTLVALTALVAGLYGFYAMVEWVRARIANRVGAFVEETLSPWLLGAIARSSGRGRTDPVRDLDSVRSFLSGPGPAALFDLPWVPLYLGLITLLHPMLGLVTAIGAAILVLLLVLNEFTTRGPTRLTAQAQAGRQRLAEDIRAGGEVVRAMAMESQLQHRWGAACAAVADAATRGADRAALHTALTRSFRYLLQSAVLATGAWLVLIGQSSAGLIIGASILSSRAVTPVEQAIGQWRAFVGARQAWPRLREYLADPDGAPRLQLPPPLQRLAVEGLTVLAPQSGRPLVKNVRFALRAGDGLGIVGLSGSGKSSLARALVGVWPHAGEVRLDGQDLRHYDRRTIGAAIGYLPQEVGLFAGTVAENIARFRPGADATQVISAAKAAGIHDLIATLPDGYQTQVGEGGVALSAGQRQRIGLARALFGDPFLIVLDEPNANLDSEGDAALTAALIGARARGAIVVVIAHRHSAIAAVDQLLLLNGGRQAAFGPKLEVLKAVATHRSSTARETADA